MLKSKKPKFPNYNPPAEINKPRFYKERTEQEKQSVRRALDNMRNHFKAKGWFKNQQDEDEFELN